MEGKRGRKRKEKAALSNGEIIELTTHVELPAGATLTCRGLLMPYIAKMCVCGGGVIMPLHHPWVCPYSHPTPMAIKHPGTSKNLIQNASQDVLYLFSQ